jgi:hypothetical protein
VIARGQNAVVVHTDDSAGILWRLDHLEDKAVHLPHPLGVGLFEEMHLAVADGPGDVIPGLRHDGDVLLRAPRRLFRLGGSASEG